MLGRPNATEHAFTPDYVTKVQQILINHTLTDDQKRARITDVLVPPESPSAAPRTSPAVLPLAPSISILTSAAAAGEVDKENRRSHDAVQRPQRPPAHAVQDPDKSARARHRVDALLPSTTKPKNFYASKQDYHKVKDQLAKLIMSSAHMTPVDVDAREGIVKDLFAPQNNKACNGGNNSYVSFHAVEFVQS